MWKQMSLVLEADYSVWWRRRILGQPFQADKVAICLLLQLMAYWAPACHHALPLSALGTPPQRGGAKGGWGRGVMNEDEERRGESERMWPEPWGLAKSPSLSASPAPPSTQPLTGCPSPHNGRLSAEISRYWIPGLEFCPVTMSRQRSMLQGRHTLQVKSWKTIPPFISIKKGRTLPPHSSFFHHLFSFTFLPCIKLEESCF